ncbi:hypothetical protein ACKLNR_007047 [Fusarium oxysporum f. sp. zingiberi]
MYPSLQPLNIHHHESVKASISNHLPCRGVPVRHHAYNSLFQHLSTHSLSPPLPRPSQDLESSSRLKRWPCDRLPTYVTSPTGYPITLDRQRNTAEHDRS